MDKKEMVCIVCPRGCRLTLIKDENAEVGYVVTGNACKRGAEYGIKELTNPTRVVTSTVKINNYHLNRLPVKTNGSIPKDLIFECMKLINEVEVEPPIKVGEILIDNMLETGVDLVSSKSASSVENR
jgi:CxxC motif-containing protein